MPASSSDARRWNKKRKPQDDNLSENSDDDVSKHDPTQNPNPNTTEIVVGEGTLISKFPEAVKQKLKRTRKWNGDVAGLENVSHGQMETASKVPRDDVAGVVIGPMEMVGGRGVEKQVGGRVLVVPMHADWFSTDTVHRLERQVVPHFFFGNSAEDTPEKYMECRNRIVVKYMENSERRLSLADCQGWVTGFEMDDLARVVRFLDHWGIINYCASAPINEPQSDSSILREDSNGDVHVPSVALKSIDSLFQFDKSKCKLKAADVYPSLSCDYHEEGDLDSRIREQLSENRCYYCSNPVPIAYYQSQKEDDLMLCMDCFNDGRFVTGHSSIDFVRLDTSTDYDDLDGESWTNQETLLLLEAVEVYKDSWNEIAEHVGSKSKAQCILHFIRLPTDDGRLENVEVPGLSLSSNKSNEDLSVRPHSSSNGDSAGSSDPDLERELPFASSANPVMSLVAFLASAVGPRVAAACAHTSLAVLSEDTQKEIGQIEESVDSKRMDADSMQNNRRYPHEEYKKSEENSEENSDTHGLWNQNGEVSPLSAEKVRTAVKAGLAAAATKAKLFADHEEREIQRLSANIINHQLKRLELKLKQFTEVEALLIKECEQMEQSRQRLAGERSRMLAQYGNSVGTPSIIPPGITNNTMANRQNLVTASSQPFLSSGYNSNQLTHSHIMGRQQMHGLGPHIMGRQQMHGLGPRLSLSALHPSSSASLNAMFNSPANDQPALSHPMLRSLSGTSSSLG